MRSSLIVIGLLLFAGRAVAAEPTTAGDAPSADVRSDKPKADKGDSDAAKASVDESAQPQRRSIPFHGRSLAYTVTPGTLTEDSLLDERAHNYLAALARVRADGEQIVGRQNDSLGASSAARFSRSSRAPSPGSAPGRPWRRGRRSGR
jgi:hypothetical protein